MHSKTKHKLTVEEKNLVKLYRDLKFYAELSSYGDEMLAAVREYAGAFAERAVVRVADVLTEEGNYSAARKAMEFSETVRRPHG